MTVLRVGGVPEHFNFPIRLAIENGLFEREGIEVRWTDFSGGTGHMMKALRDNDQDLVIPLTEGTVTDIIKGNPAKIISQYVLSPLIWGIHTGNENALQWADEIFDKKHAISRFGSGSHLMAIVNAHRKGVKLDRSQFNIINNLEGAISSLDALETDVFYWEKYTTKPHVDAGKLRRIGEYMTPWPCFVIAATNTILNEKAEMVDKALDVINESCRAFMNTEEVIEMTAERYQIEQQDVEKWYHKTEWATNSWVSDKMIQSVIYHLKAASIIEQDQLIPEIIWKR